MGVLEAGGTGLVEHGGHMEARRPEGVEREQPLRPVGMGGHCDHDICILATRVSAVENP